MACKRRSAPTSYLLVAVLGCTSLTCTPTCQRPHCAAGPEGVADEDGDSDDDERQPLLSAGGDASGDAPTPMSPVRKERQKIQVFARRNARAARASMQVRLGPPSSRCQPLLGGPNCVQRSEVKAERRPHGVQE